MFYCSAQTTSIMISSWEPFNLALDAADGTSKAKTPRWIKHNRRFKSWIIVYGSSPEHAFRPEHLLPGLNQGRNTYHPERKGPLKNINSNKAGRMEVHSNSASLS